jgi:ppGpp synthetase/RelA/SpoT-type nucleotidyltranferase
VRSKTPAHYYQEFTDNSRLYEHAADEYERFLVSSVAALPIQPAVVKVRPKDGLSLYKKLQKKLKDGKEYKNPWVECPDLVGARVTVALASDKTRVLADLLKAADAGLISSVEVDDKELDRDPKSLHYSGLHVQIHLPGLVNHVGDRITCEVQIRTAAEHTWAETEHKYIYKGPSSIPSETRRVFARLLALVELLDQELDRGATSVSELESYALLQLSQHLEAEFRKVSSSAFSTELTQHAVAEALEWGLYDIAGLAQCVREYTSTKSAEVLTLLEKHGPHSPSFEVESDYILSQPELLLYLAMLDSNPHGLGVKLENTDMYDVLKRLAVRTGARGFLRP